MPYYLSANRLTDGLVVFFKRQGHWSLAVGEASIFADKADLEANLAIAQNDVNTNQIVDLEPVAFENIVQNPKTLRDRIRVHGPTIDYARKSISHSGQ